MAIFNSYLYVYQRVPHLPGAHAVGIHHPLDLKRPKTGPWDAEQGGLRGSNRETRHSTEPFRHFFKKGHVMTN